MKTKTRYFLRIFDGEPCYYLFTISGNKTLRSASCQGGRSWDSNLTLKEAVEADYLTKVSEAELALVILP